MQDRFASYKLVFRLFAYARPYWRLIAFTMLAAAVYSGLYSYRVTLAEPLFNKALLERAAEPERIRELVRISVIALLLALPIALSNFLHEYLQKFVVLRMVIDLRERICGHLLHQRLRFFSDRKAGDLISRVTNDISTAQVAMDFLFGDLVLQVLLLLGALAAACYASWRLALFVFVLFPIFALILARFGRIIKRSRKKSLVTLGHLTEAMHQMFSGIRIVKAFQMQAAEMENFARGNQQLLRRSMKVVRAKSATTALQELVQAIAVVLLIALGAYLVVRGQFGLTPGGFAAFIGACILMNRPAHMLSRAYNNLQESLAGCERVFELLDSPGEPPDRPAARRLEGVRQGIEFRNVSFAYDTVPVLDDVDLEVRAGQVVAVVGPTGAGKSTLMDLLARFYEPAAGVIAIDGVDLRDLQRESLLQHLAIVAQETFLFNTTIADNIRYGRRGATQEEIEAAARAAGIHELVLSRDRGYQTVIGERGVKLSGGQKQLLAIARAMLKNPSILILDEATSALDAESERQVQEALANLMKGRTTFVIAHRLSTVQRADRIVVVEGGRIAEQGTHEQLLARKGVYERLYRIQFAPRDHSNL